MAAGSMGGGGGGGSNPGSQYFSLRWNNHPVNLVSVFTGLYQVKYNYHYSGIMQSFKRLLEKVLGNNDMFPSKIGYFKG